MAGGVAWLDETVFTKNPSNRKNSFAGFNASICMVWIRRVQRCFPDHSNYARSLAKRQKQFARFFTAGCCSIAQDGPKQTTLRAPRSSQTPWVPTPPRADVVAKDRTNASSFDSTRHQTR